MPETLGSAFIDIRARTSGFDQQLRTQTRAAMSGAAAETRTGAAAITGTSRKMEQDVAGSFSRMGSKMGSSLSNSLRFARGEISKFVPALSVAIPAAIGVAAVKFASMAGNFQQSMTELVTGAGESEGALGKVSAGVLAMAGRTGESSKNLASGLYLIESAGFHGAQGLKVLETATQGARVGAADMATVADAVTTALNAYGRPAEDATRVTNALIATVASGKTHMDDLASSLSTILPVAASLHVPLEQVGGAMATMTGQGIKAKNAATFLRFLLLSLVNPAQSAKDAMQNVGISSTDLANTLTTQGLGPALQMITTAVGKEFPKGGAAATAAMATIVGGARGMQAALTLTGTHMETLVANTNSVTGAVKEGGNTVKGWDLVQGEFNQRLAEWRQGLTSAAITIGTHVIPVIEKAMGIISGLGRILAGTVGFFEHNRAAAETLGTVLAVALVPRIIAVTSALATNAFARAAGAIGGLGSRVGTLVTRFRSLATAQNIAGGGVVLLAVEAYNAWKSWEKWDNAVRDATKNSYSNAKSMGDVEASLRGVQKEAYKSSASWKDLAGGVKGAVDAISRNKAHDKASAAIKELHKNADALATTFGTTQDVVFKFSQVAGIDLTQKLSKSGTSVEQLKGNVTNLGGQFNASYTDILSVAESLGPEVAKGLTGPWEQNGAALDAVRARMQQFQNTTGLTLNQMHNQMANGLNDWVKLEGVIKKAQEATAKAFSGATDIIANFDPSKDSISSYYKRTIKQSNDFANNIQTAIEKGLDPSMVEHMLEAGPAAAGPLLDKMVSGHGDRMVKLANASEKALEKISYRLVEFSRLNTLAMQSGNDQMTRDLKRAMAIDSTVIALGAKATVDAVAKKLHLSKAEVGRVGDEFGISFADHFSQAATANMSYTVSGSAKYHQSGDTVTFSGGVHGTRAVAEGGPVRGAGTKTSDSIPAWLSNGEYVVRAAAVDRVGIPFLNAVNRAGGGLVGPLSGAAAGGSVQGHLSGTTLQIILQQSFSPLDGTASSSGGTPAQQLREAITNEVKTMTDAFRQSTTAGSDLPSLFNYQAGYGGSSVASIEAQLRVKIRDARQFTGLLRALARKGLARDLLLQLVQAGPEAGGSAARELLADPQAIAQINDLERQLQLASSFGAALVTSASMSHPTAHNQTLARQAGREVAADLGRDGLIKVLGDLNITSEADVRRLSHELYLLAQQRLRANGTWGGP